MRIDGDGASLAYTADTGPGWSLSKLGSGFDVALCEASLAVADERTVQHLSGRQAGITATAADVRRLLLTHVQPGVDAATQLADARASFHGLVELVETNVTYEIGTT